MRLDTGSSYPVSCFVFPFMYEIDIVQLLNVSNMYDFKIVQIECSTQYTKRDDNLVVDVSIYRHQLSTSLSLSLVD